MSAPFRIRHPHAGMQEVSITSEPLREYFERLIKMIPAEVVGLYMVGSGMIPNQRPYALAIWTVICLVGVVAIRAWGTSDTKEQLPPQWTAVLISAVSFLIWVYSLGGPFAAYGLAEPYIGSLLILAWTFFVPIFYKGSFN